MVSQGRPARDGRGDVEGDGDGEVMASRVSRGRGGRQPKEGWTFARREAVRRSGLEGCNGKGGEK